jgi:8-oxo-dGTP pyrophosphatase MutT (NUDIX family)
MPGLWEPPGGGLEPHDPTILHGAAREALEESGLVVARAACVVGRPLVYTLQSRHRSGPLEGEPMWFGKLDFVFELAPGDDDGSFVAVTPDPAEHCDFAWASERELLAGQMADGRPLPITYPEQKARLLQALRMRREGAIPPPAGEGDWIDVDGEEGAVDEESAAVVVIEGLRDGVDETADVDLETLRDPTI